MSKKFLISEGEKKHILDLYGLLKEEQTASAASAASAAKTAESLKLDQRINFRPGYYNPKFSYTSENGATYEWDVDATLKTGLGKIKEFLKNNPTGYVVDVTLESGESRIPNNDVMQGRKRVEPGYLNDARLKTLKDYLTPVFGNWKSEGINTNFTINEKKTIGKTAWVGTPFCPANSTPDQQRTSCYKSYLKMIKKGDSRVTTLRNKYNKEQYFRVVINVNRLKGNTETLVDSVPKLECIQGIKLEYNYDEVIEQVAPHCCNRGRFYIYANDIPLKRTDGKTYASINNDATYGEEDKQKDSREQLQTLGVRWASKRDVDLCYTSKNKDQASKSYPYRDIYNSIPESKPGNYRYNTFIITPEDANKIVAASGGKPGVLTIKAVPAAQLGGQQPHQEAIRMQIYRPDGTIAYDSCNGYDCDPSALGPWTINFCPSAKTT